MEVAVGWAKGNLRRSGLQHRAKSKRLLVVARHVHAALPPIAVQAEAYFKAMRHAVQEVATRLEMPIDASSVEDCRSLTTRLWLFPNQCHVRFYEATAGSVKYVIAPHPTPLRSYVPHLTRADARIFYRSPEHTFIANHADYHDPMRLAEKAHLAAACFLAERGFYRGLRRIEAQGKMRRHYWAKAKDMKASQTSFEVTTILQASCVEALLKDPFFAFRSLWNSPPSDPEAINFQFLRDARRAYRDHFAIDLRTLADATMSHGWQRLHNLMQLRHRLVHGYSTLALDNTETFNATSLINDLQPAVLRELRQRMVSDRNVRL